MPVNRIYFRIRKTFRGFWLPSLALCLWGCGGVHRHYLTVEQDLAENGEREHTSPDWAKGLVWYQVFPERFRNGNLGNDPSAWDVSPLDWDADWAGVHDEEIERAWNRGRIAPEMFGRAQVSTGTTMRGGVYARRYGGDLQGLYEQLSEIKAMGFTGVYLCPVFESRSLHKYDASDHRHIDPMLGHPGRIEDRGPGHTSLREGEDPYDESTWAWTPADRWFVDVFLPRAKSLGLRVMLDGVWNHVGLDHFAFQDVRLNGEDSAFADWFEVVFDDHGRLIGWQGWSRVNGSLPEFRHVGDDIAPGPKAHVMAVTRRWMDPDGDGDPSDGIDGWRLDVAGEIGAGFWADWRGLVKSINPDALIVAEIWHDADEMLGDAAFDSQMNYPFAYAVSDWLSIGNASVLGNAEVVANRLRGVFHHGAEIDLVQLNLMGSHDTERLSSMMQNSWPRGYDNESSRWFAGYEADLVDGDARSRALAAIATMVASPGAVMMYNGDEYGVAGADDPDNRRPLGWGAFSDEEIVFSRRVSRLLGWRQDDRIGRVLLVGEAEFGHIGTDTLLVRRVLDDLIVEIAIAPTRQALDTRAGHRAGYARDYETERKLMAELQECPVAVRVFVSVGDD